MNFGWLATAVGASAFLLATIALAQDTKVAPDVLERMAKEKAARKACKIEICNAFAKPQPDGGPIQCDMTKTWLATQIQKRILGDNLTWPYGRAQCKANIELDRRQIAKAVTQSEATLSLKKHNISCQLDHKDPKQDAAYNVNLSIQPKVTFKNGKAVKAEMGWGNIDAPTLIQAAIWSATKADQYMSVMSSGVVEEINPSLFAKCADDGIKIGQK